MDLHPDFKDLLSALADSSAEYLIVGGWAVSHHAEPRFTKDLDLFIGPSDTNLARVAHAAARFGAPASLVETLRSLGPEEFLFLGHPPVRIDLLRKIDGLELADAFADASR